jgi:hypothetical protein
LPRLSRIDRKWRSIIRLTLALGGRSAQIAAITEGRAEWVKPTLERQFAVAVVRPQGAQKLPLPATLPLFKPQLSTPFYVTGSILKVWASSAARWQTGWLSPRHKLNSTVTS